ncbi:MAG: hypothetical protein JNL38_25585 [Myxococcales bacterium]|nr:hypothetical protein [Myxococcales bacterium]
MKLRALPLVAALVGAALPARALDKQGSAHGGAVAGAEEGFDVSGALLLGIALYNPSYAARPDNTGLTLMRYAAHADIDLVGRRLSIPVDVNLFSDRERPGALALSPTEGDVITGLTSTWDVWPGALELGARFEHDRPLDRSGFSQTYADARLRYLYSASAVAPAVGRALRDGDVSGWLTLGVFALNPTYAARPDNTGLALFRYGGHVEVSLWSDHVSAGLDATLFSDRRARDVVAPSEIDLTPELIGRLAPFELHLAYERDMPVDRPGLVQHFVYALAGWELDLSPRPPKAFTDRNNIHSP